MDKKESKKSKNRKSPTKPKSAKKKTDGPACSMFLVELSRKLAQKKKEEQNAPKNIVASILESLTNVIPIVFRRSSSVRSQSPVKIETLQTLAPELQRNDLLDITLTNPVKKSSQKDSPQKESLEKQAPGKEGPELTVTEDKTDGRKKRFKIPKMPVVNSEDFKLNRHVSTLDVAVNTSSSHDLASHLTKYVATLKKISLIAEEFNQKTAKNLKEIVDSVQEDLQVKLEELKAEQRLKTVDQPLQVEQQDIDLASTSQ